MFHEGVISGNAHHVIPWHDGEPQLWAWLEKLEELARHVNWYGDVGFYFLPYLPEIFKRYPTSRAVCLERLKKEVIRSYLGQTKGRNHWYRHRGVGWAEDPEWDHAFPHYAEPDKAKALGLYWDQYHSTALEYCARFPDNFMLIPMAALNLTAGRLRILEFIGYDDPPVLEGQYRANELPRRGMKKSLKRLFSLFSRSTQL